MRSYFGQLWVAGNVGVNANGDRVYACVCVCGRDVLRTVETLHIRKLGMCSECRKDYVAEKLENKAREKRKHAHHQPVDQVWTEEEEEEVQGPSPTGLSSEKGDGNEGVRDQPQEAEQRQPEVRQGEAHQRHGRHRVRSGRAEQHL